MGSINNKAGRPVVGSQAKTVERKIRLEPYLDEQLTYICWMTGISKAEAIRIGIRLFIKHYKKSTDYY